MVSVRPRPADQPPCLDYSEDPSNERAVLFDPRQTELGHWIEFEAGLKVNLEAAR